MWGRSFSLKGEIMGVKLRSFQAWGLFPLLIVYCASNLSHEIHPWSLLQCFFFFFFCYNICSYEIPRNLRNTTLALLSTWAEQRLVSAERGCFEEHFRGSLTAKQGRNNELSCAKTKNDLPMFNTLWERFISLLLCVWSELDLIWHRLWTGGNQHVINCNLHVETRV